jgi:hypothetical protein
MRRGALVGGAALCVVAITAVVTAWLAHAPALDRADAREMTRRALRAAGLDGVEVSREVVAAQHQPADGSAPIDVWKTIATVEGGTVVLDVDRDDGRAVYLDDLTADGTAQLLDDEQFRTVDRFTYQPALDDRLRRNGVASLAGVAIVGVAVLLVLHVRDERED